MVDVNTKIKLNGHASDEFEVLAADDNIFSFAKELASLLGEIKSPSYLRKKQISWGRGGRIGGLKKTKNRVKWDRL